VTNRDFTKALGRAVHRPTLPIPVPGAALRLAVGPFADEGILIGQRLAPAALQRSGFAFAHDDLDAALRASL
jgi:NAD dependent epimerase/dehydratase family enzyme